MTIADGEVRIDNIKTKLELNQKKEKRLLEALEERLRRDELGVINAEQKKELTTALAFVAERIDALETELEHAIEIVERQPKGS